jgi:hypothetical protein
MAEGIDAMAWVRHHDRYGDGKLADPDTVLAKSPQTLRPGRFSAIGALKCGGLMPLLRSPTSSLSLRFAHCRIPEPATAGRARTQQL